MLGFNAMNSARVILGGIEMIHMMRKVDRRGMLESAAVTR